MNKIKLFRSALFFSVLWFFLHSNLEAVRPAQSCATQNLRAARTSLPSNSIQRYQTIQSSARASLLTRRNFEVFSFDPFASSPNYFVPATVRWVKTLPGGLDLVIWVEDALWNEAVANHLNRQGVVGTLTEDRQSTIDEVGEILESIVIPTALETFGPINEPSGALFSGLHILLYDIQDNFDLDGGFIGGFFDPFDQDSRGAQMNLLHMDVYPSNPTGRSGSSIPKREDFFHTLAHELFHLIHYQIVGDAFWFRTSEWVVEGLAQFAIFRVFSKAFFPGSGSPILPTPQKAPGQVSFYLENPETTYLLDAATEIQALSVEYYGLGYLFFSHLWHSLGPDGDRVIQQFLEQKVDHLPRLNSVLSNEGFTLDSIFGNFVLAQYFDQAPYDLDFVDLRQDSFSGRLPTGTKIDLSLQGTGQIARTRNYEVRYLEIQNPGPSHQRLRFEAKCANSATDTCKVCALPFHLLQLPSRSSVDACQSETDPLSCFYALGRNVSSFHSTISRPLMKPGTSSFAAWWSTTSSCSRGFNELHLEAIDEEDFRGKPFFSFGPKLSLKENRVEAEMRIEDDNSTHSLLSYRVFPPGSAVPIVPESTSSLQAETVSIGKSIRLTWYSLEDLWSLEESRLELLLGDLQGAGAGETYTFEFLGEVEPQMRSQNIPVEPGWNMLAFDPVKQGETWGELMTRLSQSLTLGPCVYTEVGGSIKGIELQNQSCEAESYSAWVSTELQFGDGFFLHSSTTQTLSLSSVWPPRTQYKLHRGWNLKSLQLSEDPGNGQIPLSVPIVYRLDTALGIWKKKVIFGLNEPLGIPDDQRVFRPFQSHWIYSLGPRFFRAPE